jgi:GrpB-like predicted nucleotidyltransferase (UPF0157 family)
MNDAVRLMHYAPAWRQEFEQTKSGVFQSCQGDVTTIEHIGSTAIPGLIARPIIDLVACVTDPCLLENAANQIEGLYFRRTPTPVWCQDSILLVKPRHGECTHYLWLTCFDSRTYHRAILVRDHLRQNPARAVEFEEAKVRRWKAVDGDAEHYERDKALFFAHLEEQLGL